MRSAYSSISTLVLSLLLSACGGGGDRGGPAALASIGATGVSTGASTGASTDTGASSNDTSTVKTLISVSTEEQGANCTHGGVRIDAGPDGDDNGMLAAGEVSSTQYACHDALGATSSLVQMRSEPSGANCTAGGKAISVGADGNANGVLEASEIGSTRYVCNSTDGSNVVNELNTLASIVSEAAGANCVHGGSKVDKGPDSNANGVLDAGEVSATNYICNSPPATTFPWVDVTAAAVQAQSNTGYVARNDAAQVVVTLPANPAVGDVVRVKGAGLGGWSIAQNPGQAVDTQSLGGMAGAIWTAREPKGNWLSVASSADGRKLVAAQYEGKMYMSSDSGISWTVCTARPACESDRSWWTLASSADGSRLVATGDDLIYTSNDSGVSWTACTAKPACEPGRYWTNVVSSADGSKLVAVEWDGLIYTSIDGGASWTVCTTKPVCEVGRKWASVASSADGSKLVVAELDGPIYTSTDGGVSWTARESTNQAWTWLASSADGNKLVAEVRGGKIYTSTDGGASWTPRESNQDWYGLASSADGSKLVAARSGGQIYTSADSGVRWTARESTNQSWRWIASSADGSKLVAVVFDGQIYTSTATTAPGAEGSIGGSSTDAIDLQYVGDGMFTVLTHQGSLTIR